MTRTHIKICGIKKPEHAMAAAKAGAHYVGLVFVSKSPRFVRIEQARAIKQSLPEHVETVGLFVDHTSQEITSIAREVDLSIIQLHGHEPIKMLDALSRMRIWKALPFHDGLIESAKPWDSDPRVEALLIDTPPTGTLTGGSGIAFDWAGLSEVKDQFSKPLILAGGLTPGNVTKAITTIEPYAVDVSSGVESSRGVKDAGLIKAFCEAVREADVGLD